MPDPRVKATAADVEAQFQLQMRMVAGIKTTFDAYNYIDKLRAAIASTPSAASLVAALAPVQTSPGPPIAILAGASTTRSSATWRRTPASSPASTSRAR